MNLKRRRVCGLCSYSRVVPYILFDNVNFKPNEVVGFYGCYAAMKLMSKSNKEKRTNVISRFSTREKKQLMTL